MKSIRPALQFVVIGVFIFGCGDGIIAGPTGTKSEKPNLPASGTETPGVPSVNPSPTVPVEQMPSQPVTNMPTTPGTPGSGNPGSNPPVVGKGILDCPTVPYPGGTVVEQAAMRPSDKYQNYCAACHGAAGQGDAKYPTIPGGTSKQQFMAMVRNGSEGKMPKFPASLYPDTELLADFDRLLSQTPTKTVTHPSLSWTIDEAKAKKATGLAAFRKKDAHGAACANCHAPDGLDLAVLAYPDAAILRRATLHLPPEDGPLLVDLIHAQRRLYNIQTPCSLEWRPLQPGGRPLEGATALEQDLAYFRELKAHNVKVVSSRIQNKADAAAAAQELLTLNIRKIRMGIPFARWTEDGFNGDAHRTINDWIPAVPRTPTDDRWYKLFDSYAENPSTSGMQSLLAALRSATSDNGYPQADDRKIAIMFFSKYVSVLTATHYFRMALSENRGGTKST
jgi:cytochrome c553